MFLAREVELPRMQNDLLIDIRRKYEKEYAEKFGKSTGKGLYTERDWRRIDYILNYIPGNAKNVLDVGAGPGALMNYFALSKRFERVCAIDIREYTRLIRLSDDVDLRIMDASNMEFADNEFDLVICMEVIEHLPDEKMQLAIDELRRVCSGKLVMSVPFEEPEPLPSYHLQRFDKKRIQETFPRAEYEIVGQMKIGCPWLFAIENFRNNHAQDAA